MNQRTIISKSLRQKGHDEFDALIDKTNMNFIKFYL